jgi:hypothetical protein
MLKGQKALTGAQKFQLWSALVELQPDFERGRTSIREAAEIMTRRLGFTVLASSIRGAIKQGIVSWKEGKSTPRKRVEDIEKRVAELEDLVLRLLSEKTESNGKVPSTTNSKSSCPIEKRANEVWVGK